MKCCVRLLINGRVQGVWYRGWMEEQARVRDIQGWVRNRRDGSVEAMLWGEKTAVTDLVRACWKGPPLAQVEQIAENEVEFIDAPDGFCVTSSY